MGFARAEQSLPDKQIEYLGHICENGEDLPEIRDRRWEAKAGIELPAEN